MNPAEALSRRAWLARLSGPAALAALGPGLAAAATPTADRLPPAGAGSRLYNIRDHGAAGDGMTLDTAAVQSAVDLCAQDGGGTVLVPAGDFLTGTVELRSNVALHLAAGGRLLGSGDIAHYRPGAGLPPNNGNVVLLSASGAENVAIEGPGTIDGNGAKFFNGHGDNTGPGGDARAGYFQRPHLLVFYRCRNLRLRDAFLTASAYHCVRILECERVLIDGVRIHSRVNKNNDGFHFNGSRHVHLANCDVACQDDACALFGSCQFVTVTNSTFSTRWSVFRFGGGEARNITVSNCVIHDTYGCPIKLRAGVRSRFENILFANLVLDNVTGPISIGLDSTSRRRRDDRPAVPGVVRNIAFHGLRATVVATGGQHADLPFPSEYRPGETRTCIVLNGVGDEHLENISFSDVHVTFAGGGTAAEAAPRSLPPIAGEYFEAGTPPAYGCYARNVHGLTFHNVRFEVGKPDLRPAVVLDQVADATLLGFSAAGSPAAEAVVRCRDSRDVLLAACRVLTSAAVFLQAEGEGCAGITIDGGDLTKAAKPLNLAAGAGTAAVKLRA